MAFEKYNIENLASGVLNASISSTDTTVVLNSWQWDLFPTSNFFIKIEQLDSTSVLEIKPVLKREVMLVAVRVWDILTVSRWQDFCPVSDTATTQTNTHLSFDAWDVITQVFTAKQIEDIQDEITDIENIQLPLKLDITDYITNAKLYSDSTTWTDAYQITLSDVTAYNDWMNVYFKTDVANNADATLEINALWPKSILKFNDRPLETWDIEAWMIVHCAFNSTDDTWEVLSTMADYSNNVEVDRFSRMVTLWEDITAWDWKWSVFYGSWILDTEKTIQTIWWSDLNVWDSTSRQKSWFIFTPDSDWLIDILKSFELNIKKVWSPTDNIQFNLYESDKTTPVAWFSQQIISWSTITTSYIKYNIDWQDVSVIAWTTYFLEISRSWVLDASNYYQIEQAGADIIANYWLSEYNWTTRTDSTNDIYFYVQYWKNTETNKVYLSDIRYEYTNKSDWIVIQTWLAWESKKLVFWWILTQSLVSPVDEFFLNNNSLATRWDFSNTRPILQYPRPIWQAKSTTEIQLMINDVNSCNTYPQYWICSWVDNKYLTSTNSVTSSATNVYFEVSRMIVWHISDYNWSRFIMTIWARAEIMSSSGWRRTRIKVEVNWVQVWTERTTSTSWVEVVMPIVVEEWDEVVFYVRSESAFSNWSAKDCELSYDYDFFWDDEWVVIL